MNANKSSRSPKGPAPVTREQVAALAHELWRERGCPEGSDVEIWLEAERQLGAAPIRPPSVRDPIPADPDNVTPDTDVALNPPVDREIQSIGNRSGARSPTAFDV